MFLYGSAADFPPFTCDDCGSVNTWTSALLVATDGARSYVVNGDMSGGFALVAWPAQYDVTGVMTFIVNQDGTVSEKDLGPGTDQTARAMTVYDPDPSWTAVQ